MSSFAPLDHPLPLRGGVLCPDGWVAISGQVGHRDFVLVSEGFEGQLRQALTNLSAQVALHGGTLDNVVKTTVLLADIGDFDVMNRIYLEFFDADRGLLPARTAYQVAALPFGALVELDAWDCLPPPSQGR
jgi:2-iminobutanoate/2-iminopropanoate deaminase